MIKFEDPHTATHLVGCYGLFFTFQLIFPNPIAFLTAVSLGVAWELLDYFNMKYEWKFSQLDPRGADISDIIVDVAGAGLAWLVLLILR